MSVLSREPIGDDLLDSKWTSIGEGGFGEVYKTRHKKLGFDVAVKLLRQSPVYEEAEIMEKASSPFVLRVYGIYHGRPRMLDGGTTHGIVMEFMERGCIGSLQTALRKAERHIPWPLAFRLAHEVALGMNFLHSKGLLHQDLKPNNVLLNDVLKAKLGDFGLCRTSATHVGSQPGTGETGGTLRYMPPESFELSYKPVRNFDVYSYGVLLWSIFMGQEPFPDANVCALTIHIKKGTRPKCEDLYSKPVQGLRELTDLMKKCWDGEPSNRPAFSEIIEETESVFLMHKQKIHEAVNDVVKILDSSDSDQQSEPSVAQSLTPASEKPVFNDVVDHPAHQHQIPDIVEKEKTVKEKAKFIDDNFAYLVQNISEVMPIVDELKPSIHQEAYSRILHKDTSCRKVRELYEGPLRAGGKKLKAAFYDAIVKHQPATIEDLDD
ncbi:unnamed protein product [Menidia menidia]|nr:unnamed protein product [Menidia menidia]